MSHHGAQSSTQPQHRAGELLTGDPQWRLHRLDGGGFYYALPSPHVGGAGPLSSGMRNTRRHGIPDYLMWLLLSLGLLLPEAGHAYAHHHAAEHHGSDQGVAHHHTGTSGAVRTGEHGNADHPHLNLLGTPSAKPLLAYAVIVRAVALLLEGAGERPLPLTFTTGVSPGWRAHGPPPPSRAPPQV
jgi:hypothetical protein